jgi:hypothetical protein
MKKALLAAASVLALSVGAQAEVKMGVILGFTGPIESLTPDMAAGAELAMKEASDSGKFLGGETITPVRGDSTCVDAAAASAAAERLITSDNVVSIMGADCSGVTTAVANNVAIPNGVVMISPSATSPALSTIEDNGLFFRTAPSDARQGQVLADVVMEQGSSRSPSPTPTTTTARVSPIPSLPPSRSVAARSPSPPLMRTARATTRLKSARWPLPAATRSPCSAMSTRVAAASCRMPSTPAPSRPSSSATA